MNIDLQQGDYVICNCGEYHCRAIYKFINHEQNIGRYNFTDLFGNCEYFTDGILNNDAKSILKNPSEIEKLVYNII